MNNYFTMHGYSRTLENEFCEIPEKLIDFFKKHKHYIHLPRKDDKTSQKKRITYENIKGEGANSVPDYVEEAEFFKDNDSLILTNNTKKQEENANRICCNALSILFNMKKQDFSIRERHYMVPTRSKPVRIRYNLNKKKQRWPVYAKKAESARIMGRFLYEIISGMNLPKYTFNRAIFIEDSIKGNCVDTFNEKILLNQPEYIDGIIRAACHADFLELHEDVISNPRNRVVSGYDTVLFDFNMLFTENKYDPEIKLTDIILRKYNTWYPKIFTYDRIIDTYIEEREQIIKRVSENNKIFFSFLKVMNNVKFEEEKKKKDNISKVPTEKTIANKNKLEKKNKEEMTFEKKIQTAYNANNLEDFYENKMKDMSLNHIKDAKKIFDCELNIFKFNM